MEIKKSEVSLGYPHRRLFGLIGLLLGLIVLLYWPTASAAVRQWQTVGTYNHCFLILPICLYLLWCGRDRVRSLVAQPDAWGGLVILFSGGLWLVAYVAGIAEIAQFALVAMIEGALFSLLGRRFFSALAIPFLYLFLLVPTGDLLVAPLQAVTARVAATLLDLVGTAAFRDGLNIEVSGGDYRVAPGCAGLNFFLAALALSLAYAELMYRSWSRRLAFILGMLALSVVGNSLRVFLIILVANATGNYGNIAGDHLLYGWGFFSLLLFGAMAWGGQFRQDLIPERASPGPLLSSRSTVRRKIALAVGVIALLASVPAAVGFLSSLRGASVGVPLAASTLAAALTCGPDGEVSADSLNEQGSPKPSLWAVNPQNLDALAVRDCRGSDDASVHLALGLLTRPIREGKLLGLERWLLSDSEASRIDHGTTLAVIGGESVTVQSDVYEVEGQKIRLWSLPSVNGQWQTPGWPAALAEVLAELRGGHRRAALLLLASSRIESDEALRQGLANLDTERLKALTRP